MNTERFTIENKIWASLTLSLLALLSSVGCLIVVVASHWRLAARLDALESPAPAAGEIETVEFDGREWRLLRPTYAYPWRHQVGKLYISVDDPKLVFFDGERKAGEHDILLKMRTCFHINATGGLKFHGKDESWWEGGDHSISRYVDGEIDGEALTWHENGTLIARDIYVLGKLHGTCERWYETGKPQSRITFSAGVEIDGVVWHEDGTPYK